MRSLSGSTTKVFWIAVALTLLVLTVYNSRLRLEHGLPLPQSFSLKPTHEIAAVQPNLISGSPANDQPKHVPSVADREAANRVLWENLRAILLETKPGSDPVTLAESLDSNNKDSVPTNVEDVPDVVILSAQEIEGMKQAHTAFVSKIKSSDVKLHYIEGTIGVVTTAAKRDLGSVIMAIQMLRRTNCTLPIEVLVETADIVSSKMCSGVLAELGATCISVAAIIRTDSLPELDRNRYLNKLIALIFSSFEHNLFIDADNLPILDPLTFFQAEPYLSHGLVAWPDWWPSSISAKHAVITSTKLPPLNGTVESGQLLVSKARHAETLLLAFYYNFYGPDYYYPLESQGAMGSGDKESFLNAALALNAPFYRVSERVAALGYWEKESFEGLAMAQYDPVQDYHNHLHNLTPESESYVRPRIAFVHHHMLKLVPDRVFEPQQGGHLGTFTKLSSGNWHRLWGPKEATEKRFEGVDMERIMWETLRDVSCALKKKGLLGYMNRSKTCRKSEEFLKQVFG